MENLRHIKPTKKYEQQAIEYINEFYKYNSEICGVGGLYRYLDNYDNWLLKLDIDENKIPSEEKVPAKTLFLLRENDDKIVGMINIRLVLNESLKKSGGHIGYSIRPTERKKGYNKINLYLGLLQCKENKIEEAILSCDKNNLGSSKTMQALGGILIEEYLDDDTGYIHQNYKINVENSVEKYKNDILKIASINNKGE